MAYPLFSIIIPFYNSENFIRGTLLSALNQTCDNIEIIAVDDGSKDSTSAILNEYATKNKKIVVVAKEKNESLLCARISGVEKACGRYCIFLDGDDTLLPCACETIAKELNRELDIYEYEYFIQPEKSIKQTEHVQIEDVTKLLLNGKISPTVWNKAYKTSVLKKAVSLMERFYANLGEDTYFSTVVSFCAKTKGYIEKPLINYFVGTGVSTKMKTLLENERVFESQKAVYEHTKIFVDRYMPHLSDEVKNLELSFANFAIKYVIAEQTFLDDAGKSIVMLPKFFSDDTLAVCAENLLIEVKKQSWRRNGAFEFLKKIAKRILGKKLVSAIKKSFSHYSRLP